MNGAYNGKTVAQLLSYSRTVLACADVMDGIAELIRDIRVQATFPNGAKLLIIRQPMTQ